MPRILPSLEESLIELGSIPNALDGSAVRGTIPGAEHIISQSSAAGVALRLLKDGFEK